jgi:methylated-DNA-[protein]-cysteine S-methyltransferase
MRLWMAETESPVGTLRLVVSPATGALHRLDFVDPGFDAEAELTTRFGAVEIESKDDPCDHVSRLRAWFGGRLDALDAIAVDAGGTPFQQAVWRALRRLRPGATTSYGALAATIGRPNASRAVGLANGSNPIAIVVPCHRVIGADGSLTGYGGGLARKRWLLDHERAHSNTELEVSEHGIPRRRAADRELPFPAHGER